MGGGRSALGGEHVTSHPGRSTSCTLSWVSWPLSAAGVYHVVFYAKISFNLYPRVFQALSFRRNVRIFKIVSLATLFTQGKSTVFLIILIKVIIH